MTTHRLPPIITGLRPRGAERVEIVLDGRPWRVVPVGCAAAAKLAVGVELDRFRARELARALRRSRALSTAVRAVRYRDHSEASLEQRLAERGVRAGDAAAAIGVLRRSGVVDDERLAHSRAALLARRGYANVAIEADLTGRGVPPSALTAALAELESEPTRIAAVVAARGRSAATWRRLVAHGFETDDVAAALPELVGSAP